MLNFFRKKVVEKDDFDRQNDNLNFALVNYHFFDKNCRQLIFSFERVNENQMNIIIRNSNRAFEMTNEQYEKIQQYISEHLTNKFEMIYFSEMQFGKNNEFVFSYERESEEVEI